MDDDEVDRSVEESPDRPTVVYCPLGGLCSERRCYCAEED